MHAACPRGPPPAASTRHLVCFPRFADRYGTLGDLPVIRRRWTLPSPSSVGPISSNVLGSGVGWLASLIPITVIPKSSTGAGLAVVSNTAYETSLELS